MSAGGVWWQTHGPLKARIASFQDDPLWRAVGMDGDSVDFPAWWRDLATESEKDSVWFWKAVKATLSDRGVDWTTASKLDVRSAMNELRGKSVADEVMNERNRALREMETEGW